MPLPRHLDPRRPRRRQRLTRVLGWTAMVMAVLLLGGAALGYALFSKYDGQIARIPGLAAALPGLSKPAAAPRDARNVLLVGSDTRATTGDEFQGTGAERTTGQRSDTIILAHLYGDSDQAQLVSFPRDSWVSIPAYTDPATGEKHAQRMDKINAAITQGGPALLIATVEALTDIRVDNYVQVDFAGFQGMVDQLGGVEVCLKGPAKDVYSGIDLPAGRQTIEGAQALAFVRQRHGLPNGDIDRITRQQAFLGSIARKTLSAGTLLNPVKLNGFLDAATSSVQVDDGLSGGGLTSLALRLRSFTAGGVAFSTVPFTSLNASRNGQSVVLIDEPKAETVFTALRRDEAPQAEPAAPAAEAPGLTVAPDDIRVSVLNAAGVAGLGRQAADDLAARGFSVVGTPANRGTGATGTVVRHGPDRADSARTLAAAVPGATVEEDPDLGSRLELLVGSSWKGAVAVTVTPSAAAPVSPSGPAAPVATAAQDGCVD